jgi:hypothetical protein
MGGTNYCFYDYDYAKFEKVLKEDPEKLQDFWDKGFTNFGVMTFDRKPKLACWELWHLWRDFEVAPKKGNEGQALRIRYVRDYRASDCRLTLRTDAGEEVVKLDDFAAKREATLRAPASTFRWRMDYTTHAGLSMVACGAYPPAAEAEDFLACLKDRETFPFLRELLDAEVLRADGRTDATTLKDMEREDGIVPIVFRKPNGVVYVTVLARKRPKGDYVEGVTLDVAFRGRVEAVDEMTGKPTDARPEVEPLPNGLRLKNVRVPFIPSGYGARLQRPLSMPAFRITP